MSGAVISRKGAEMAEYFSFHELIDSQTAKEYGINNMPNQLDIYRNLDYLMTHLLDPLRRMMMQPIYVNSGYRSPVLNTIVRGARNSQHMEGEAVDIQCKEKNDTLRMWVIIKSGVLQFDQAILYTKKNFIHLSLKRQGENRREILYNTDL